MAPTVKQGGSTKNAKKDSAKMKQSSLLSFFKKSSPVKNSSSPSGDRTLNNEELASPTRKSGTGAVAGAVAENDDEQFKENIFPSKESTAVPRSEKSSPLKESTTNNIPSSPTIARDSGRNSTNEYDDEEDDTPVVKTSSRRGTVRRKISYVESDDDVDDAEELQTGHNKRRRTKVDYDDPEDDDFVVPDHESDAESDDNLADDVVPEEEAEKVAAVEDDEELDDVVAVSKTPLKSRSITDSSFNLSERFGTKSTGLSARPTPKKSHSSSNSTPLKKNFAKENEERYQWLVTIKDAEKRLESDPDYDPRTLYIPQSAWNSFTSFEKQYWEIKSKMWDCIVFFKKGKFYELYEKDADLAHNLFELKLAGGGRANMRLAGVPEMSFDYWASAFIAKGYKVAKVDQKESMLAKSIRDKSNKTGKKDAVVHRELEAVLTVGTLTDEKMLTDDMATYCLALKEGDKDGKKVFGVAFVDTATGIVKLTEFDDDSECSKLETVLAQVKPKEVLVERNCISSLALKLLKFNSSPGCIWNYLKSGEEFWDFDTTFENLTRLKFFKAENLDDLTQYPKALVEFYEQNRHVGFSAFGALFYYLRTLKLDQSIFSMGKISKYDFIRNNSSLVLDGVTLQNLEIFSNSFDGSDRGTLFKILNRGVTLFGKRLFRSWVIHPLYDRQMIEARLDSVELLMNDGDLKFMIESRLSKLPDLERLISRVHSGYLKIKDFVKVIEGFEEISLLIRVLKQNYGEVFDKLGHSSLGKILNKFPAKLESVVNKWSEAFDRVEAVQNGVIIPQRGVELEFDESSDKVSGLESQLNQLLKSYRREFKCQEMCYKDSGKEIFLLECPKSIERKIPSDWIQMGATNKLKRYWPPEVKKIVDQLMELRELHKILMEQLQARLYQKFDQDSKIWSKAVNCIAGVDCLIALANASESLGTSSCRPQFVDNEGKAMVDFKSLRHPCFNTGNGGASGAKDFIPNDVKLGGAFADPNIALLTGANAAGKSTLLRMTCIAVVMLQIGCFVPCESAVMTPIDKIMTRLGANDNIMQGKSTFYVELSETKRMLESATPRSLIVLDELGRGGSSSDGFAIAELVLHHVATHVQSIGFFATHYSTLGLSFKSHPQLKAQRMAILVEPESRNITFLYKLEEGTSSGSFGMHVASMCGIEDSIVDNAEFAAKNFEHTSKLKKNSQLDKLESENMLIPLGLQSDFSWLVQKAEMMNESIADYDLSMALRNILRMVEEFDV